MVPLMRKMAAPASTVGGRALRRRPSMERRNATAAVIGAGDFIGSAIARKFAAEGFTVFAGRRNGEKLAPLVHAVEATGRPHHRPFARRAAGGRHHRISARGRRIRAARGLHLQCRRQRQLPTARYDRARVPQGVGDGVLCRLPRRPRGSAADAAAWPGRDLLHRRDGQPARRRWLCGIRRCQGRAACGGAERGARAWSAEHPRGASGHRRRRGYRLGARTHQAARGRRRRCAISSPAG